MDVPTMNPLFVQAIEEKRRLRFTYRGKARLVEPQCYGIGHKGTELLRVYQPRGGSEQEPLFDVAQMEDIEMLDERFERPGPHYKRGDSAMRIVLAQL
jgi:hypothetical protein